MLLQLKFLFSLYLSLLSWLHSGAHKKGWWQSGGNIALTPGALWVPWPHRSILMREDSQRLLSSLPPSISSLQVMEVPLQKSGFHWREMVPSGTNHIALQSVTHYFCLPLPLWRSSLLKLRALQCHPVG